MELLLKLDGRTDSGGSPLIMHNERLADPLDTITRELAAVTGKRKKTEADHLELARIEYLGGLYTTPPIASSKKANGQKPILPGWNILSCLEEGAKRHKRGRDVVRGVFPKQEYALLTFDGPAGADELWKGKDHFLRKGVKISTSRTIRTRPLFTDWQAELLVEVDPIIFDVHSIVTIWKDCGRYAGIGDNRPRYGRFEGTVEVKSLDEEAA